MFLNAASFSKYYTETIDLKNELSITINHSKCISKCINNMRDKQIDYINLCSLSIFIILFVYCMRLYADCVLTFCLRMPHYSTLYSSLYHTKVDKSQGSREHAGRPLKFLSLLRISKFKFTQVPISFQI